MAAFRRPLGDLSRLYSHTFIQRVFLYVTLLLSTYFVSLLGLRVCSFLVKLIGSFGTVLSVIVVEVLLSRGMNPI